MAKLNLINSSRKVVKTNIDSNSLDGISEIKIEVISGDEVAIIKYKSGEIEKIDSRKRRSMVFHDGDYEVYNERKCLNLLVDPDFINRECPYQFLEPDYRDYGNDPKAIEVIW